LALKKKEEEERRVREAEEKKQREIDEKRLRLEEAEKKRQAMMQAMKASQQPKGANFTITKKDQTVSDLNNEVSLLLLTVNFCPSSTCPTLRLSAARPRNSSRRRRRSP